MTDTEHTNELSPQQVFIKPQTQAAFQTVMYVIICCQKNFVGFMINASIPYNPKQKNFNYSLAISATDPQLSQNTLSLVHSGTSTFPNYASCLHVSCFLGVIQT